MYNTQTNSNGINTNSSTILSLLSAFFFVTPTYIKKVQTTWKLTTEAEDPDRMKLENITMQLNIKLSRGESCSAKWRNPKGSSIFIPMAIVRKNQLIVENDVDTPIKSWNVECQEF